MKKLKFESGEIEFKNNSKAKAEIYFYGYIVDYKCLDCGDTEDDVTAIEVKNFLEEIGTNKDIDIRINSGGGSVFAGTAIYNLLKNHKGHKTVYIDGLAGSIASVIAMAGDEIIIPSNAYLMIHKPSSFCFGFYNVNELNEKIKILDKIETSIISIYESKLKDGVDIEEIKQMINDETWLIGNETTKYFNFTLEKAEKISAFCNINLDMYKNLPKNFREFEDKSKATENLEINKLKQYIKNNFEEF